MPTEKLYEKMPCPRCMGTGSPAEIRWEVNVKTGKAKYVPGVVCRTCRGKGMVKVVPLEEGE